MVTLVVPPLDEEPWPTLGPAVCDFIETFGVYGPGDLAGEPYKITPEFRAQLYRAYEVFPKGHELEGRRRFKQVSLEERKGTAKTERGALVVIVETHPEAEVRFDGWRKVGRAWEPVGRPMLAPYVPMVAYTVEQTEDLGYGVLRFMLENGPAGDAYDVGLDRVVVLDPRGREAGRIVPLASSPNARDGARTTFQYFDEPHRMNTQRLRAAWSTMGENVYKRREADAWTLTTSTAGEAGEDSVEEAIWREAVKINEGKASNPRLFFFRRFADPKLPLETREDVHAALVDASGPNASWSGDLHGLVDRYFEEKTDKRYFERVWLNRWGEGANAAFDVEAFRGLAEPREVGRRELITLGFDGSIRRDCTALVATAVYAPHQWLVGLWERPEHDEDWEVPWGEVDAAVDETFRLWPVWRLYGDPFRWREPLDRWAGRYGSERVISWNTTRWRAMAHACRNYRTAIASEAFTHDGSPELVAHVGHARRRTLKGLTFDDGEPMWTIGKERPLEFIDAAVAGLLSWEARNDAVKAGAKAPANKSKTLRFS
jgi:hypothetical protein